MVLLAPAALGTTHVAPFKGIVTASQFSDIGGCQKVTTLHKASFSLTTGQFLYGATDSAFTCAKSAGFVGKSSFAEQSITYDAAIAFTVPSGPHVVTGSWSAAWALSGSQLVSGSTACPTTTYHYSWGNVTSGYCSSVAEAEVFAGAEIYDATNGTYWFSSGGGTYGSGVDAFNYTENYNDTYWYCYTGGSCSGYNYSYASPTSTFSNTGSVTNNTVYYNHTFVATHHYWFIAYFDVFVYASAQGWAHSTAKASLNAATLGNGVKLNSITVT